MNALVDDEPPVLPHSPAESQDVTLDDEPEDLLGKAPNDHASI